MTTTMFLGNLNSEHDNKALNLNQGFIFACTFLIEREQD